MKVGDILSGKLYGFSFVECDQEQCISFASCIIRLQVGDLPVSIIKKASSIVE